MKSVKPPEQSPAHVQYKHWSYLLLVHQGNAQESLLEVTYVTAESRLCHGFRHKWIGCLITQMLPLDREEDMHLQKAFQSLRSVKMPFLKISPSTTTREKAKGDLVSSDRSLMLGGRSHFSPTSLAPNSEKQNGFSWLAMNQKIPAYQNLRAKSHFSLRVPL